MFFESGVALSFTTVSNLGAEIVTKVVPKVVHKYVYTLIPMNLADVIKVMNLKIGRLFWIIWVGLIKSQEPFLRLEVRDEGKRGSQRDSEHEKD